MKLFVAIAFLLAAHAAHASVQTTVTKDSTITKVVKILETMMEKSKKEGAKEATLFGKYQCYCDTNEAEKTASITDLTKKIGLLGSNIQELKGENGKLSAECAELRTQMQDNEAAREEAQGIRDKAEAAFLAEEADLKQAIGQMDDAITTLAEVGADQTAKLVQVGAAEHSQFRGSASLLKLSDTVKHALSAASVFLDARQTRSEESFLQAPFTGTYTSQSAEIVGILKNMRDTFKQNLANAQATESAQKKAFTKFMATKKEAYDLMKADYDDKQENLGANDDDLSAKKEQLANAEKQKAEDEEFLAKLLAMCAAKSKEYEERKMMRANEEAAVAEAISILNSDAAFATFQGSAATSTGATGFLQLAAVNKHTPVSSNRAAIVSLLEKQADKSARVSKVVAMLKAENPFDEVLAEIEKMIDLIAVEAKEDKEKLEWCNTEREESHGDLEDTKKQILTLEEEIDTLDDTINNPEKGLKAQLAETQDSLAENYQDQVTETKERTEANLLYQKNIKNLVTAADIVKRAEKVLKKYYEELQAKLDASFLQRKEEPAPPETFGDEGYKGQSEQGNEVLDMLKFILDETWKEEKEAHSDEKNEQHDFEDSMADLKKQESDFQKQIAKLEKTLAEKEEELLKKQEELAATEAEKKRLKEYLADIKPGCDFITENFDQREKNRATEKKSLKKGETLIKDTPVYKAAVAAAHDESLGECKDICKDVGEDHVECKACLAETTVPGYCAGHKDTKGC
eukprot:gnl/TRDRNA2_/TRDRNA2_175726_c0_seq21.p1 gnl/TRDRNA2_/TRDRNA2_175726_c0~~gnl/TRDRNA2_/TRDRNA2_175726_c0_seq21.p1  ORF type:complete len:778 (+),score=292.20 gnl/TRDRNA2_/TRDRNA2_175726_c0_seq21:97-2334(+)